jgi:hypothetical protein
VFDIFQQTCDGHVSMYKIEIRLATCERPNEVVRSLEWYRQYLHGNLEIQ